MTTGLDIGVTPWAFGTGGLARDFAEQGAIAERLGFHSFWLPENHFGDERSIPSPLMLLGAVAARTETIKLGSSSYLLPIRHPLQAAEEVAVLDRMSGGRVILGVGRGVQESMFKAFDINTRDKRKKFRQNLALMISAWRGDPIAYLDNGDPVILAPRPVQVPHPPIWIAAFGPLALKQAGSLGLPYLASPVETLAKLMTNYERHQAFATAAGFGRVEPIPVMRTLFISDHAATVVGVKQALAASGLHAMRDDASSVDDWTIVGDRYFVRDKLNEYRERLGMSHLIARGRIPGVDSDAQLKSLEQLSLLAVSI